MFWGRPPLRGGARQPALPVECFTMSRLRPAGRRQPATINPPVPARKLWRCGAEAEIGEGEGKLSGESFPSPRAPHPFKDFRLVGRLRVRSPKRLQKVQGMCSGRPVFPYGGRLDFTFSSVTHGKARPACGDRLDAARESLGRGEGGAWGGRRATRFQEGFPLSPHFAFTLFPSRPEWRGPHRRGRGPW